MQVLSSELFPILEYIQPTKVQCVLASVKHPSLAQRSKYATSLSYSKIWYKHNIHYIGDFSWIQKIHRLAQFELNLS